MTTGEVLDRMRALDAPIAPAHNQDTHLTEPQVVHNQLYTTEHDPRLGEVRVVRYPAVFDGEHLRAPFTAPRLGGDAGSVAKEWGIEYERDPRQAEDHGLSNR
jgi:crotonobetainyl-CoA:carnitine CoA-transferase CaiB-like acyl-CoA transferase